MRRTVVTLSILALLVTIGLAGGYIWIWISGGPGAPSTSITAPPLSDPAREATSTDSPSTPPISKASSPAISGRVSTPPPSTPTSTTTVASNLYRITPEESEVRYIIDEVKRGQPITVVGTTNQVAGDIRLDLNNPATSRVGVIRINVRTLQTDEERRDRATRSRILQSAQPAFEFSEFSPTTIDGLPASVEVGIPVNLRLHGDLTIRDITHPVSFDVTVTLVSLDRLEGKATTTVQRSDYNLVIPRVPFIADVSEDVRLEIDLVARLVNED